MSLNNRYDFVLVFDVQDGNPNGDPDAGNLPRMDPETGHGLVTDVCLKRKIRNYVLLRHPEGNAGMDIYVKEKAVLGQAHVEAFRSLNIKLGEENRRTVDDPKIKALLSGLDVLPDGVSLDEDEGVLALVVASDADKKAIMRELKEAKVPPELQAFVKTVLDGSKPRKPTSDESDKGRQYMCKKYFDIRTFGAVMSLKSAPNCGQVRGPVQLTFARSVDPIVQLEHSITRMAVATEAEAERQSGDNRTMGRKATVPYGIYVAHGFVSAPLASDFVQKGEKVKGGTGFGEADLAVLWQALGSMFEHDRSAARGLMTTRRLVVFKHDEQLGNARAADLFERVKVTRDPKVDAPRKFSDYEIKVNLDDLPTGVNVLTDVELGGGQAEAQPG